MSDQKALDRIEDGLDVIDREVAKASPGSLHSRMRARAEELQSQTTQVFPVPGYSQVLAVELMALGWEAIRKVQERHRRVNDAAVRELYIAADLLLASTVKFYEVDEDGRRRAIEDTWRTLAEAIGDFPQDGTARQAIIRIVARPTSSRLINFHQEWHDWASGETADVGEELAEDFGTTR